jgi:hypothetical protein
MVGWRAGLTLAIAVAVGPVFAAYRRPPALLADAIARPIGAHVDCDHGAHGRGDRLRAAL